MNSLRDPALSRVLDRLHAQARDDEARWAERRRQQALQPPADGPDPLVRLGSLYMAFGREEGELLYLLARGIRAARMVEFGASFGVSTLYLGAAAKDNGGCVITTEVHPDKCVALRRHLADAGLAGQVELREGDARETLKAVQGPVDLLVLDGWKSMYLEVLHLLQPVLRDGALVVADNISHAATRPYVDAIQAPDSGFVTRTVGDLALSSFVG